MPKVKIIVQIGDHTEMFHTMDFARWYLDTCRYDSEEHSYHTLCLSHVMGYMAARTITDMLFDFGQHHGTRVQTEKNIIDKAHERLTQLNNEEIK